MEWKKLESEAVSLAEKEEFDAALELFNKAVNIQPEEAASYNNRAQLLRLKGDTEGNQDYAASYCICLRFFLEVRPASSR